MYLLLIASLIWAFSFGLIKGIMPHIDPFVVGFLRLGFASVLGGIFYRPGRVSLAIVKRFFIVGLIQLGLMYAPYMASFKYLKAHEVALFTMTTPLYIVLIGQIINRRFYARTMIAALLAVAGGCVVAWKNLESDTLLVGILLVQLSNILFAIGQWLLVSSKFKTKSEFLNIVPYYFMGALSGSFVCLIFSGHLGEVNTLELSIRDWLVIAGLGTISSGLGFIIWNIGALRVNFAQLAVAVDFKLPTAILVSLLVFGEKTDLLRLAVSAAILCVAAWLAKPRMDSN